MNKWMRALVVSLGLVLFVTGCSKKEEPVKDPKAALYDFSNEKSFVVYGE